MIDFEYFIIWKNGKDQKISKLVVLLHYCKIYTHIASLARSDIR